MQYVLDYILLNALLCSMGLGLKVYISHNNEEKIEQVSSAVIAIHTSVGIYQTIQFQQMSCSAVIAHTSCALFVPFA